MVQDLDKARTDVGMSLVIGHSSIRHLRSKVYCLEAWFVELIATTSIVFGKYLKWIQDVDF